MVKKFPKQLITVNSSTERKKCRNWERSSVGSLACMKLWAWSPVPSKTECGYTHL